MEISHVEHGAGDNVVLAARGNLGCADWFVAAPEAELVLPPQVAAMPIQ
jgi:hypothetical protein